MARKPNVFPSYLRHSSGQARIRVDGRDILLGLYGSDESRIKYGQLIAQMAGGVPLDPLASPKRIGCPVGESGGRIKVRGRIKGGNKGVRNLYRSFPTKVPPPGLPRWFPRLCATKCQLISGSAQSREPPRRARWRSVGNGNHVLYDCPVDC